MNRGDKESAKSVVNELLEYSRDCFELGFRMLGLDKEEAREQSEKIVKKEM